MIAGIIIGVGVGMTATTLLYGWMLINGGKRRAQTEKTVEALLVRKADGIERIGDLLESKINVDNIRGESEKRDNCRSRSSWRNKTCVGAAHPNRSITTKENENYEKTKMVTL